jgi:hypothetical protein
MFKSRAVILGIGLLLIALLLPSCASKPTGVETQLGTVVNDSEILASLSSEPTEYSTPQAGTDDLDYIRALGYLLNGQSWADPAHIAPVDLLMWYAQYERDQQSKTAVALRAVDGAYHFPRTEVEEAFAKFFGLESTNLRGPQWDELFDSDTGEYVLRSELPEVTRSLLLNKVENQDTQKRLYFTVSIGQKKQEYLLILNDAEDSVRYQSLTGPNGEVDTPRLIGQNEFSAEEDIAPEPSNGTEAPVE